MPTKALITEADIQQALQAGRKTIVVEAEPMLTPLAASSLKEAGLEVVWPGHGSAATALGAPTAGSADDPLNLTGRDRSQLLSMYTTMLRIRAFEEAVGVLFRLGHLIGFLHLSIGQEAVPTGACAALRPDDYLTLTHRGHGQMVARGSDLNRMLAELLGRVTGYCRGKGGSVHLADFANGILGANGIVGAGIVIATGAAMSAKLQANQRVALAFFGDGAVNQGAFHEALNYAAAHRLPALYVCENNQYAVSMAASQATASPTIADRGLAYRMPCVQVDGQNVLAVYDAVHTAAERARRGDGPTLIECLTYRFRGHWEGETTELRPEAERQLWQRRDPIERLGSALVAARLASQADLDAAYAGVVAEIAAAVRFAQESPYPEPEEAVQHVTTLH